jgi:branched-chain amino acid transport system permease protein
MPAASQILLSLMVGISTGMIIVLISTGLSLTFGTMRIVNMAHGGFFMVAAFLVFSITRLLGHNVFGFTLAVIIAIAATVLLGALLERVAFRRMYGREHMSGLLGTFALMLMFQGGVQQVWGLQPLSADGPPELVSSAVSVLGASLPLYNVVLTVVASAAFGLLGALAFRTRLGLETRAVAMDRSMAALLGVNVRRVFALTFAVGTALAALAGALMAPLVQIDSSLAATYIVVAFAIVLVGGIGSVLGTFVAGLGIGIVDSMIAINLPVFAGYAPYIAMALVIAIRPSGLFGSPAMAHIE